MESNNRILRVNMRIFAERSKKIPLSPNIFLRKWEWDIGSWNRTEFFLRHTLRRNDISFTDRFIKRIAIEKTEQLWYTEYNYGKVYRKIRR